VVSGAESVPYKWYRISVTVAVAVAVAVTVAVTVAMIYSSPQKGGEGRGPREKGGGRVRGIEP
jgi:hypothetical protein